MINGSRGQEGADKLISNLKEAYGDHFQSHLLEQYKLYVDSAQKVSEKRISTGNFLLTVSSSLLTVFGIAAMLHVAGRWLLVIPAAGLLVSFTWYSLVVSYKNLNSAKFRVIHELEAYLPAALFRYEWHCCGLGDGKAYRPVTHFERLIPIIFAIVYVALACCVLFAGQHGIKRTGMSASPTGTFARAAQPQGRPRAQKGKVAPAAVPAANAPAEK